MHDFLRKTIYLLIALLLIVAGAIAVYFALPAIATRILASSLRRAGASNIKVVLPSVTPVAGALDQLSFDLPNTAPALSIHLRDARVLYDLSSLWKAEIKSIAISSLRVELLRDSKKDRMKDDPDANKVSPLSVPPFSSLYMKDLELTSLSNDNIALHDVISGFTFKKGSNNRYLLRLVNAEASVFGGTISSQSVQVPFPALENEIGLRLNGIDLEKVGDFYNQKRLQMTGILDGVLPLTIHKNGISVKDGKLQARSPGGNIRYQSENLNLNENDSVTTNFQVISKALENFVYDKLSATVNYQTDGKLLLSVFLEGNNPSLYKGRQINFNINIEENLPALFRSLSVGSQMQEGIKRQLQKHFQK